MRASDISQIPVLDQDVLVGILDEEELQAAKDVMSKDLYVHLG